MYRIPKIKLMVVRESGIPSETRKITASRDLYPLLREYFSGHDREEMVAVMLNMKHMVTALHTVAIGSLSQSLVHPRETFKAAITLNAAAVILAHNHPSGDPSPSQDDRLLTTRLKQVGELIGIPVLDHLIIGTDRYVSFADEGWLPS